MIDQKIDPKITLFCGIHNSNNCNCKNKFYDHDNNYAIIMIKTNKMNIWLENGKIVDLNP